MADRSSASTHPVLSYTDAIAASTADTLLVFGRIMLGWLFLKAGWGKFMNVGGFVRYLTNLGVPDPGFWAWPAMTAEVVLGIALIFGIATRYAALAAFAYLIIATVLGHHYWTYPAAQQFNQFNHFLKNIAIMGGVLFLFVAGPGRFSVDRVLASKS